MRSDASKRGYLVIVGIVAVMTVLFTYMWIDTRRLERSLSPKEKPTSELTQEVKKPVTTQTESGTGTPQRATLADHREPIKRRPLPQRDRPENQEPEQVVRNRREDINAPSTGLTSDWMFKKGTDLEDESVEDTETEATPE